MRVYEGDTLTFLVDDIPYSMNYDIVIRYETQVRLQAKQIKLRQLFNNRFMVFYQYCKNYIYDFHVVSQCCFDVRYGTVANIRIILLDPLRTNNIGPILNYRLRPQNIHDLTSPAVNIYYVIVSKKKYTSSCLLTYTEKTTLVTVFDIENLERTYFATTCVTNICLDA